MTKEKISETWETRITYLEENNGEMEVEIECSNGKEVKRYSGYLSEGN